MLALSPIPMVRTIWAARRAERRNHPQSQSQTTPMDVDEPKQAQANPLTPGAAMGGNGFPYGPATGSSLPTIPEVDEHMDVDQPEPSMAIDIDTSTTTPAARVKNGYLSTADPESDRRIRVPRSSLETEEQRVRLSFPTIRLSVRRIDSDLRSLIVQRYPLDRGELGKPYDRVIRMTRYLDGLARRGFVDESTQEVWPYIRHLGRLKKIVERSEMFGVNRGHYHGRRQFRQAVKSLQRTRLLEDRIVRLAMLTRRPGDTARPGVGSNTSTGIGSCSSSATERNGRGTGSQNSGPEGDDSMAGLGESMGRMRLDK